MFERLAPALAGAIGVGTGWVAAERPDAEQIAAHWPAICATSGATEPHSVYDEALASRKALLVAIATPDGSAQ